MNVVTGINTFTGVNNTLRPDLVGDPAINGSVTQWFNNSVCDPRIASGAGACSSSSVFALPVSANGAFHFGNLVRNGVYGPAFSGAELHRAVHILQRTRRLYASYLSTFSEAAWWLGGARAEVDVF